MKNNTAIENDPILYPIAIPRRTSSLLTRKEKKAIHDYAAKDTSITSRRWDNANVKTIDNFPFAPNARDILRALMEQIPEKNGGTRPVPANYTDIGAENIYGVGMMEAIMFVSGRAVGLLPTWNGHFFLFSNNPKEGLSAEEWEAVVLWADDFMKAVVAREDINNNLITKSIELVKSKDGLYELVYFGEEPRAKDVLDLVERELEADYELKVAKALKISFSDLHKAAAWERRAAIAKALPILNASGFEEAEPEPLTWSECRSSKIRFKSGRTVSLVFEDGEWYINHSYGLTDSEWKAVILWAKNWIYE